MTDLDIKAQLSPRDRKDARAFARLFSTKDGIQVLERMKQDIGWDEAGPFTPKGEDKKISNEEWTGCRRAIVGIRQMISIGQHLIDENLDD